MKKVIFISVFLSIGILAVFLLFNDTKVRAESGKQLNLSDLQKKIGNAQDLTTRSVAEKNQLFVNKENLSEAEKKLSTSLLQLSEQPTMPAQNLSNGKSAMQNLKQFIPKGDVLFNGKEASEDLVYVYVNLNKGFGTNIVDKYAEEVKSRDEENNLAVAYIPVSKLELLASLSGVRAISPVFPPDVNMGSAMAESDEILRTDQLQALGSLGAGVKVGVISDGADHVANAQASGDLPAGATVLGNANGGDEGTAMMEIIYDMAPGAELYFHDSGTNWVEFNNAIDDLYNAGCRVIVDDIAWTTVPYFEDGIIASHVASLLAADSSLVYISSADNYAEKHYQGTYSAYSPLWDFFYPGTFNHSLHDFNNGSSLSNRLLVYLQPGGQVIIILEWNDQFGSSSNDYDLYLADGLNYLPLPCPTPSNPSAICESISIQDGNDDPIEAIIYQNTTGSDVLAEILVNNAGGLAASRTLELFSFTSGPASNLIDYNFTSADSIFGHSAVTGVIAAAAIDASDSGHDTAESFSSRGPSTITYPTPQVRAKPDITGIDGVAVTGAGGFSNPFFGTSAAAPTIAAVAAHLKSIFPGATRSEISNLIEASAVDLGTNGFDYTYGYGRADAYAAFAAADTQNPTVTASISAPADGNSGWYKTLPTITLTADDDIGVSAINYRWNDNSYSAYSGALTPPEGEHTLQYYAVDVVAKSSSVGSQSFKVDTVAPTGTVFINSDAAYTNSTGITLTLAASDSVSGIAQMRFSNDNSNWSNWETYGTAKSWTINDTQGQATVYAQFIDLVGNATTASDSIIYDSVVPVTAISPLAGSVPKGTQVTLTANETAAIYYTTDGSTPTTSSMLYSSAITINVTTTLKYFAIDQAGNAETVQTASFTIRIQDILTMPNTNGPPQVVIYKGNGAQIRNFMAYDSASRGSWFVTSGDINGDGTSEIITAPGPGFAPQVRVFSQTGTKLYEFYAYQETFRGGVSVAVGDIENDGKDEIVTMPYTNGGALCRIFSLRGSQIQSTTENLWIFSDRNLRGGFSVTMPDFEGDGLAEIVATPISGGASQLQIFGYRASEQKYRAVILGVKVHPETFHGGMTLGSGDLDGDGDDEVVTGVYSSGGPVVIPIYRKSDGTLAKMNPGFMAYHPNFRGGISIAAADTDSNGKAEIITAVRTSEKPYVTRFDGQSTAKLNEFYAFPQGFTGGVNLGILNQ